MLYRVSGKLTGGRTFSIRVDATSAIDAVAQTGKGLTEAKEPLANVVNIVSKPMEAKGGIYIGEAKKPKGKK